MLPLEVVTKLSATLRTTAICFLVHDGDNLCYWLSARGEMLDQFNSIPDYFGGESSEEELATIQGNPEVLAKACGKPEKQTELAALLANPEGDAIDLLAGLSDLLGIENSMVGFNYLGGERQEMIRGDEFLVLTTSDFA